jgi:hypothetical protein
MMLVMQLPLNLQNQTHSHRIHLFDFGEIENQWLFQTQRLQMRQCFADIVNQQIATEVQGILLLRNLRHKNSPKMTVCRLVITYR